VAKDHRIANFAVRYLERAHFCAGLAADLLQRFDVFKRSGVTRKFFAVNF
jgi:hypothetical protein